MGLPFFDVPVLDELHSWEAHAYALALASSVALDFKAFETYKYNGSLRASSRAQGLGEGDGERLLFLPQPLPPGKTSRARELARRLI